MPPVSKDLQDVIQKVGELPAMPAVVSDVLRLTEDPKVEMGKVGKVIEGDPAMTAKILKVSNSSYYGMKQYVGTLKMALVILGVREVRNIVLGISVFEAFKDEKTDVKLAESIWEDSLLLAGLCKRLSAGMVLGLQGEEFITGLLANIGKMILLKAGDADYAELVRGAGKDSASLCASEGEMYGYNHADAASALAAHWNLPQPLADALWCQYPSGERPLLGCAEPKLAAALRVGRATLCDNLQDMDTTPSVLRDEEAWNILAAHARNPIAPDLRRATLLGLLTAADSARAE